MADPFEKPYWQRPATKDDVSIALGISTMAWVALGILILLWTRGH